MHCFCQRPFIYTVTEIVTDNMFLNLQKMKRSPKIKIAKDPPKIKVKDRILANKQRQNVKLQSND